MKKTHRILFGILGTMLVALSSPRTSADQVGNGGDAVVADFLNQAELAVKSAEYFFANGGSPVPLTDLRNMIKAARVESTDTALTVSGVPKDALNYPELSLIVVNRGRWIALNDPIMKRVLTLHEYLGLMHIDDSAYGMSRALLNLGNVPTPTPSKSVDVLLVLDDSGSMLEAHGRIWLSIAKLIDPLLSVHANIRLGILTSDLGTRGQLQPNGQFLSAAVNPVDFLDFVKYGIAKLGTVGSGIEQPLGNLMESISAQNLLSQNGAFYQGAAPLEIVIVTDTHDQTQGLTAAAVLAGMKSVKPNASIKMHGILAEQACAEDVAGPDPRMLELINVTGGLRTDLCSPDYSAFMGDLAKDIVTRL